MIDVHLFSVPGPALQHIVEVSRPLLQSHRDPAVAYLPAAAVRERYVELTERAFEGLAQVITLDAERASHSELGQMLERAALIYVPGGNTYLLSHRLHASGLKALIAEQVRRGTPYIGFSSGATICGPTMLTTNDVNCCACTHFAGLGFLRANLVCHYPPAPGEMRAMRDAKIAEFQIFNAVPVLMLEDDGYLRIADGHVELARGTAWMMMPGAEPVRVAVGGLAYL